MKKYYYITNKEKSIHYLDQKGNTLLTIANNPSDKGFDRFISQRYNIKIKPKNPEECMVYVSMNNSFHFFKNLDEAKEFSDNYLKEKEYIQIPSKLKHLL